MVVIFEVMRQLRQLFFVYLLVGVFYFSSCDKSVSAAAPKSVFTTGFLRSAANFDLASVSPLLATSSTSWWMVILIVWDCVFPSPIWTGLICFHLFHTHLANDFFLHKLDVTGHVDFGRESHSITPQYAVCFSHFVINPDNHSAEHIANITESIIRR